MLPYDQTREALLKERAWCTPQEMAVTRNIPWNAMRGRLSYYNVLSPQVCKCAQRVALVAKKWAWGLPSEIAELLDVPERRVELDAIVLGFRQLSLWFENEFRVKVEPKPAMRIVHRASKVVCLQYSLFPSPTGDQQAAA